MTIEAELPDGTVLEFPDGTPDDVIDRTVREQMGVQRAGQTQSADISVGGEETFMQRFGIQPTGAGVEQVSGQIPGIGSALATGVTAAVAEPVAGLAGLAALPFTGATGPNVTQNVREALTIPPTEAGQQLFNRVGSAVRAIPGAEMVGKGFTETADAIGAQNPALGAIFRTTPTAALEALTLGTTGRVLSASKGAARTKRGRAKQRQRDVVAAAPSIEELDAAAKLHYDEIRAIGGEIKPRSMDNLIGRLEAVIPRVTQLTPGNAPRAVENLATAQSFRNIRGVTPTELDELRKNMRSGMQQAVPGSNDARLLGQMIDEIDDFLDTAGPGDIVATAGDVQRIQKNFRQARQLHGQKKRSELIADAFETAESIGGDFEANIRREFKKLIATPKRRRVFNPDELEAMRAVANGDTSVNLFRLLGRFGFSNNQVFIPAAGAALAGLGFGLDGAAVAAGIGHVSKGFAERLRTRMANTADAVIRAGRDADKIVAAYYRTVKPANRNAKDLSELLMQPRVDLERGLFRDALAQRAAQRARRNRAALASVLGAGAVQAPGTQSPLAGQ